MDVEKTIPNHDVVTTMDDEHMNYQLNIIKNAMDENEEDEEAEEVKEIEEEEEIRQIKEDMFIEVIEEKDDEEEDEEEDREVEEDEEIKSIKEKIEEAEKAEEDEEESQITEEDILRKFGSIRKNSEDFKTTTIGLSENPQENLKKKIQNKINKHFKIINKNLQKREMVQCIIDTIQDPELKFNDFIFFSDEEIKKYYDMCIDKENEILNSNTIDILFKMTLCILSSFPPLGKYKDFVIYLEKNSKGPYYDRGINKISSVVNTSWFNDKMDFIFLFLWFAKCYSTWNKEYEKEKLSTNQI